MEEKKSRASYFKERRKNTKTFYAEIDIKMFERLEKYLLKNKTTKKEWLTRKIKEINE